MCVSCFLIVFASAFVEVLGNALILAILVRVLLSWVQVRLPGGLGELVFGVSEPILGPIRRALPFMGGFDLSPLVAFFAIRFIQDLIQRLLPSPV